MRLTAQIRSVDPRKRTHLGLWLVSLREPFEWRVAVNLHGVLIVFADGCGLFLQVSEFFVFPELRTYERRAMFEVCVETALWVMSRRKKQQ